MDLARRCAERRADLDAWFAAAAAGLPLPPYCSADVRDAGFKVAPVDLNLFPAGHNNLNERYFAAAVEAWRAELTAEFPTARTVCIVPESHTRNTHYLHNLTNLARLLREAGYAPTIATVDPKFVNPETRLTAADGTDFTLYRAERHEDRLIVNGQTPDLLLLNNDLADGTPEDLVGLAQPILPPPALGWHARRKSHHYAHYERMADGWAGVLEIDPWIITPITEVVENVDFHEPDTFGPLAEATGRVLARVQERYTEHGIPHEPYCFIKDDAGTYGMGVLVVRSVEDVLRLNRKQRNKMDRGKANAIITRVLVQEGLPTVTEVDGAQAEPVMYAVGANVIGGFRRYHPKRPAGESLNARGAQFTDLVPCDAGGEPGTLPPLIELYAEVTRVALLAAAHEIRDLL